MVVNLSFKTKQPKPIRGQRQVEYALAETPELAPGGEKEASTQKNAGILLYANTFSCKPMASVSPAVEILEAAASGAQDSEKGNLFSLCSRAVVPRGQRKPNSPGPSLL